MSDIQRYEMKRTLGIHPAIKHECGGWVRTNEAFKVIDKQEKTIAEQDKEIESLKAEVERLTHFSHFMCETWSAIQQWSIEHFDKNNLGSFPMVQGTANQNRLRDIGEKPYKKELINQAVMELIK